MALLALVASQDVEPGEGSDGTDGRWRIARRVAPERVISTVDPEARPSSAARGEIDASSAPLLAEHATAELAIPIHVVIDMRAIRFLDSRGVQTLLDLAATPTRSSRVHLAGQPQPIVARVLELTGLTVLTPVHADLGELVSRLSARSAVCAQPAAGYVERRR